MTRYLCLLITMVAFAGCATQPTIKHTASNRNQEQSETDHTWHQVARGNIK